MNLKITDGQFLLRLTFVILKEREIDDLINKKYYSIDRSSRTEA